MAIAPKRVGECSVDMVEVQEKNPTFQVALRPQTSPGSIRLLQKDFVTYLMSELGLSKPAILGRLKKLSNEQIVWVDSLDGARRTAVAIDMHKLLERMDNERWYATNEEIERFGDQPPGPFGSWPSLESDFERLTAANIVVEERDESGGFQGYRATDEILERYRVHKKEWKAKHPSSDCHIAALSQALNEKLGALTLRELASLLHTCGELEPFNMVELLRKNPWAVIYSRDRTEDIEAKRKLFASIGEELPRKIETAPMPEWVKKNLDEG